MLPMKIGLPARALCLVPYLTPEEVRLLGAGCRGRQKDIIFLNRPIIPEMRPLGLAVLQNLYFYYLVGSQLSAFVAMGRPPGYETRLPACVPIP